MTIFVLTTAAFGAIETLSAFVPSRSFQHCNINNKYHFNIININSNHQNIMG